MSAVARRRVSWGVVATLAVLMAGGFAHAAEGDLERERRLVDTYRQMLAEDPGQEYAFRRLLETAHAAGGLTGLIDLYRDEVAQQPRKFASWLVLGLLQRQATLGDEALSSWATAANLEPNRYEPHLMTATLLRAQRRFAEAYAAFDKAIALARERTLKQEVLKAAAETAIEGRDFERASAWFEALIKTEPGNVFLRMQEAATWGRLDQDARALERWREVEKVAGGQLQHLVVIWREIAELEQELGQFAEAEATWRRGLAKLPVGHYERRTFLEGLVSVHRRQDKLDALVAELEREGERDVESLIVAARVLEELAEDERALAKYREAQRRRPGDEEVRMAALRLLERTGRPDEVLAAWVELVRAFPREPRHQLKLAELYFQQNKAREAGGLLDTVSRQNPIDPSVHMQVVDLWMRYGDKASRAKVEAEYRLLMKLEPNEPSHVMSLGEYYWSIEDRARALTTWQRLQKMGSKKGEGRYLYAEALADHELFAEALVELQAALEAAPDNERYVRALALLYEKTGKRQDAIAAWQRLLERTDGNGRAGRTTAATREAREHIIALWEKAERLEVEIAALARRFEEQPPNLAAGRFLAVALLRAGRVSEARQVVERLDALAPDDHETLTALEQVYSRQGDSQRLSETLERLAQASPRAAVEHLSRAAELALTGGDTRAALSLARRIIEAAPAEASAHMKVGELYSRMGLRAEAAEAWRQVLALEPRNMTVRFKLASLYREQGMSQREEQILTEVVRETSDSNELMRAGRRLLQVGLVAGRLDEIEAVLRPLIEGVSRPDARARPSQLRLVVDLFGYLAQALRFGPAEGREAKLRALGERAQRPLLQALEDSDIGLRSKALAVIELTRPAAATAALGRLASDPEQSGQAEAIAALGRLDATGAVQLLSRLSASTVATTRELALWALGRGSSAQAGEVLAERARRGPPRERLIAALALAFGRHAGATAVVLELARDRLHEVREVGLWGLALRGDPAGLDELAVRLSRATSPREARVAAEGLARIATPAARDVLIANLFSDNPHTPDLAVWEALSAFGVEADASAEASLEGTYRSLVIWERGVVSPSRPSAQVPVPRRLEATTDRAVIEAAALRASQVLTSGTIDSRRALFVALDAAFSHDGPAVMVKPMKEVLVRVLPAQLGAVTANLDNPRACAAVAALLAHWLDGDQGVALAPGDTAALAERTLGALALADLEPAARAAMLRLLETLAATHGVTLARFELERLSAGLSAPDAKVRAATVRVFSAHGRGEVEASLHDVDPGVRLEAARSIARYRVTATRDGLERLVALTRDPLPEIALAALAGLLAQPEGLSALPPEWVTTLERDAPPRLRALLDTHRATR